MCRCLFNRYFTNTIKLTVNRYIAKMVEPTKRELSPVASPIVVKKPTLENPEQFELAKNINNNKKQGDRKKKRKYKSKDVDETLPMGVLQFEIKSILKEHGLTNDQISNDINTLLNDDSLAPTYHRDVTDVSVLRISSNGDGLALIPHPVTPEHKQIVLIPFGIPGDIVDIRVFKTHPNYVESDLLRITSSAKDRDDSLIKCKYYGKCSGCQYQQLSYESQLEYKKRTVRNAYEFLASELCSQGKVPEIGNTVASPVQFGYRTKLTPHFDMPRRGGAALTERPPVGFGKKGKPEWRVTEGGDKSILDIEECIIGTSIINLGMKNERSKFEDEFKKYKKGATILLREHTRVAPSSGKAETKEYQNEQEGSRDSNGDVTIEISKDFNDSTLFKSCVTKPRQIVSEYINGFTFEFSAGEFFQNNNSILPKVTEYVCNNLQIPRPEGTPLYLVDAYCGSGLFSITASKGVDRVVGVDVSADSVRFAQKNAERNGVKNAEFIDGKAEKIFAKIDTPNDLTSVIIDPSRKGCDEVFLNQLSDYKPARIVYVSCNVHSQARDVQWFLNNTTNGPEYKIESIRGFDFFPQTHHVESVAVLTRV